LIAEGVRVTQPPHDITCRELVELVTEYFEGALDRRDRRRFEKHIAGCVNCAAYVDQMRQTVAAVGHLDERSLDQAARDELMGVFRNWRRDRVSADS
jgi:anti-sigma factor RsiW